MSEETLCQVCAKSARQKCAGCHLVFYCTKEHQKSDWKTHKKACKPYKVCQDDTLGRYLEATRDIKPNEIVLKEAPLIWGPAENTVPVCLGCGNTVDENCKPCFKCGWPFCSETCQKSPAHIPECRYTVMRGDKVAVKNFGIVHPIYQCITVLRCLYQKQFLPEVWEKIDKLESHCEHRKNHPKYENDRVTIAQFILRFFKLGTVFTEEEILRIVGILTVNGHEVPLSEPCYEAIYQTCSMFEHNCRPNCRKSFTDDGQILITSGQKISKGDHLTICYTDPLWGTSNRRHHLYQTKYFWCNCSRCKDVTEGGTNFSTMKCQNECNGYILPKTFLDNEDGDKLQDWECNKCKKIMNSYSVHEILERLGKDLSLIEKGSSKSCKEYISHAEDFLHSNHYYLTDAKINLSQLLGHEEKTLLPNLSEDDILLKAKLCRSLTNMIKKLVPGEHRLTGLLLFELHAAIAEIGRRGSPESLPEALMESKNILMEAMGLLKFEPESLPEGKIYKQAQKNLIDIERVLKTVQTTFGDKLL
ncbi:unnamed protein product [Brassicogethes aeneus]|uniref:Protein msta n=1 Tax=Brassicogethes aeneus TaxID=1431903 RepID=A0A9P0FMX4_BRAAE|nr:unnamed protein product [Brassicogethes aeneus]